MANTLFPKGREKFLRNTAGSIDWVSDDIRVMLVKSTYTYDSTDEFLSDIGAVDNGRSAALTTPTATNGFADADDTTLTATASVACNALILFKHTGADGTASLIAYMDTMTGLPMTPAASATITITWANSGNYIFKL